MEPGYIIPPQGPIASPPQEPAPVRKTHWWQLVTVLLVLLGSLFALGIVFGDKFAFDPFEQIRARFVAPDERLQGQLFFTLTAKSDDGPTPYVFDFSEGRLKLLGDKAMPGKGVVHTLYHSLSADGYWGAFVGVVDAEYEAAGKNFAVAQVYRVDMAKGQNLESAFDQATPATFVISAQKRLPSVSPAGGLVYTSRGKGITDKNLSPLSDAESWVIYHVDITGVERYIDLGVSPKWIDANHFVYWKNDGMYLHTVSSALSEKVWGSHGPIYSNMKMDVSDDGRFITWSAPDSGRVFVLEVLDWGFGSFSSLRSIQLRGIIDVHGFWTAISPDNKYIAVQAVDWENLSTNPRPRIVFYSMENLEKIPFEIDLDAYQQEAMFMTDWVQ